MRPELENLQRDFQDNVVEGVMSEVMLEILGSDVVTGKEFLKILTRLSELAKGFIDTGRFEETLLIYNTLYTHSLGGRFKSEALNTIEYFFHSQDFTERFIRALRAWGLKNRDGAARLSRPLRKSLMGPLLAVALDEEDENARKLFLSLLVAMGRDLIPVVMKALHSDDAGRVRMLLYLVRKCGTDSDLSVVRTLLGHKNQRIGTAAVRTLLHFKTKDSLPYLKIYLESREPEVRLEAIELAGLYRLKETVPAVEGILDRKDLLGTAHAEKVAAVRALGRMGDISILDRFSRILETRSLISKGKLEDLKLEIFRSLRNFPPEDVEPLLRLGVWSDNQEMKAISAEIMGKLYGAGETPVDA